MSSKNIEDTIDSSQLKQHLASVKSRLKDYSVPSYESDPNAQEDPEVYYTKENSAKRILFSGEDIIEVKLPSKTRVIYPRKPIKGLGDVKGAIRYAFTNPEAMAPLPELLKKDMKLSIAVDDISLPLPLMKKPDLRQSMLEVCLEFIDAIGIHDVHIIIATAFHRRMTNSEIKRMVGPKIFKRFFPKQLYNHDGENKEGMKFLGHTEVGETAEINRRASESDLLIYLNINFVPMNGGNKSVATGLAGYKSLREHHDPEVIASCNSYMDHSRSTLADSNARLNTLIESKVKVFHLETAINNRMFSAPLSFLTKNEDNFSFFEKHRLQALKFSLKNLNHQIKRRIFSRIPSPYECIGVHGGEVQAVHKKILDLSYKQYLIKVKGQADILILGIPFVSPYSVNSILNPLLIQVMALGYLYHLYEGGTPLLKDGGSLILFHPCRDEFDHRFHPSYIEFFNRLLPENIDSSFLQKKYELEFAQDSDYIKLYREDYGYHGVHPFYMWYWGEAGRRRIKQVIAVGAVDKHVPERMGWQNADNFEDALEIAKKEEKLKDPQITMLHVPPMLMTKCI